MLNRTNRMLSANRNRLNLGTRSSPRVRGGNRGHKPLRTRHAHPFEVVEPVRAGTGPAIRYPSPVLGAPRPIVPDSPPAPACSLRSCAAPPWYGLLAQAQSTRKPVVDPDRDRAMRVSGRLGVRARPAVVATFAGRVTVG